MLDCTDLGGPGTLCRSSFYLFSCFVYNTPCILPGGKTSLQWVSYLSEGVCNLMSSHQKSCPLVLEEQLGGQLCQPVLLLVVLVLQQPAHVAA